MTTPEVPPPGLSWVTADRAAALWTVRRKYVPQVASAHGVGTKEQKSYGTLGETTITMYSYAEVQRVVAALESGEVVLAPSWRADTEEGVRGARRDALTACGCVVLMLAVVIAVALLSS
ncbi:hypothetical protein PYK79_51350 [Streptomyces sp. ID05-04B]|uniref:hypothetical protein n=1 Tax=Streptomyces sp. ID05-04B TaxID=3028661 RepID=UPI0029C4DD7F|nr:hypothetical protein [Streptomyces sp. ID05-04B]MDX5570014.1 hypothetical protein [Streptomyces sp. ID05-04B]